MIADLKNIPSLPTPIAFSIGMFDGMHPGHQALLHHLRLRGTSVVLTFSNHPSRTPLVCTLDHKLQLLKQNVDLILLEPFTPAFAEQPFDQFLTELQSSLPFSHLILGEGASFGKNRGGTPDKVMQFADKTSLTVEYIPKSLFDGKPISSQRIRSAIESGQLDLVTKLLQRPYSILAPIEEGVMHLPELCLPPDGTYPVQCLDQSLSARICRATDTLQLSRNLDTPLAEVTFQTQLATYPPPPIEQCIL